MTLKGNYASECVIQLMDFYGKDVHKPAISVIDSGLLTK